MSADQAPVRRPAPVTQRDGSKLANSNCRMASIATGLDYDTAGAKHSTGAKMRSYTTDQEGGTDSADAHQSWDRGYGENLDIQDGKTFDDLLADLKRGRLVHIDVWHATVGGPCLSGSGGYGHTMAVLPDCRDNEWLVADPWCRPGHWTRVHESKLRAGAEKWGNQVYGTARQTYGPGEPSRDQLRLIIKRLLNSWTPGGRERTGIPPDIETGGPPRVMYTATTPQPLRPPPSPIITGGDDVGIYFNAARWKIAKDTPVYLDTTGATKVTTLKAGAVVTSLGVRAVVDEDGKDSSWRAVTVKTQALVPGGDDPFVQAILWCKAADMPDESESTSGAWDDSIWAITQDPAGRYPAAPCPDCPELPDLTALVSAAVASRDERWEDSLRKGEAWPSTETRGPDDDDRVEVSSTDPR